MVRILVVYHSRSGNTRAMAEFVGEGVADGGAEAVVEAVGETPVESLLQYDGVIAGSPTYYGLPAAEMKRFFDDSVALHGRLAGKIGAAFASAANIGGGNESTCLALLQMMLVHGMIVIGAAQGDHYGPVAINKPDDRARELCVAHGRRAGELALRLFG